jgi:hypothetical protein
MKRSLVWPLVVVGLSPWAFDARAEEDASDESADAEAKTEDSTDESSEEGGIALSQPPPSGKGALVGVVTDGRYKEPAIEAIVSIGDKGSTVLTDIDGTYRLVLPPGTYDLRIIFERSKPARFASVVVEAGKLTRIDATLEPEENAVDETVDVVMKLDTSSLEGQMMTRAKSAFAGDGVGRAEVAKSNDRTAAEAAKRVVGATVEGSRFLYVRGLGERYTNALLDGAPLPSPEPDRQAVPLDLFPSQIIDNLTIVKSFTPDMPGDFAGGSLRIDTRRLPNKPLLSGSASIGFNTNSTFSNFLTTDGGGTDFLGFDDGSRALPDDVPDYKVVRGGTKPDGTFITREEVTAIGRSMNGPMRLYTELGAPNHGFNLVGANTWAIGESSKLGVLAAITYDRRFERVTGGELRTPTPNPESTDFNDFRYTRGTDKVSWGVLLGTTFELDAQNRFSLTGFHSRSSDFDVREIGGRAGEKGASIVDSRSSFVSRALTFGQLRGEHTIQPLEDLGVSYSGYVSHAARAEPNSRGVTYVKTTEGGYTFEDDSLSGLHFYSDQGETGYGAQLDLDQPLNDADAPSRIKLGGAFNIKERDFLARRFSFGPARKADPALFNCNVEQWDRACPDQLFTDENVGEVIELEENTRFGDSYEASLGVFAGYLMADVRPVKQFRIIAGPRLEVSRQDIRAFDPTNPETEEVEAALDDEILLPALGAIYSPTDRMNLRLSVTRTLARPQIREVAPFAYTDYFGGLETQGNPELLNTTIVNIDARFEFFPTNREVLAFSSFFKRFEDPIEQVILAAGARGLVTFRNAEAARLFGIEIEGRKNLAFITSELLPLTVTGNVTFAHSRVELDPAESAFVTNQVRPLSFQAPYVINAILDFDEPTWGTRARLLYNISGPKLTQIGTQGYPDFYEEPRHQLDVTIGQRLVDKLEVRASATNLINSPFERRSGDFVTSKYTLGQTVSLGMNLTL